MKYTNTQKWIAAMLLLGISMGIFSGCAKKGTDATTTTAPTLQETTVAETIPEEIKENLPEKDYNGYEFRIYNGNVAANVWFTTTKVTAEEETGDTINDAIYRRNANVEERFNVKIKETEVNSIAASSKKSIMAGDDVFDVMLMLTGDSINLATQNLMYEYGKLPYVDLTKPWWDHRAAQDLSIDKKLYFTVSDMDTTHLDETITIFFNKKLIQEFSLPNPYELVANNQWTYDKIEEMGKAVISDLDGNGKYDENDRYAFLSWTDVCYGYLIAASGEKYVRKDAEDIPYLAMGEQRFIDVYNKVLGFMHSESDNFFYNAGVRKDAKGLGHRIQEVMFPANRALFWSECMSWSKALRDMEADFGILPPPKYNEEQEEYYNYCNNPYTISVPVTNKDLERTSILLEALAAESSRIVVPAYYEVMLKGKYARDEESSEMLDIIFNNLAYDIGTRYWASTIYAPVMTMMAKNDTGIASFVAKVEKKANGQIQKTVDAIKALES